MQKIKFPKTIISLIVSVIMGIILVSVFFGPGFIFEKLKAINQIMFKVLSKMHKKK